MKITVSKEDQERGAELRASAVKCRKAIVGSNRELGSLEKRKDELETQIPDLESRALSDKKSRMALRDARDEFDEIEKRLEQINREFGASGQPLRSRTAGTLRDIQQLIERACKPALDELLLEITGQMRPFFTSDTAARGAAWTTEHYAAAMAIVHRNLGRRDNGVDDIDEAVALLDQVLSGEVKFNFNSKL